MREVLEIINQMMKMKLMKNEIREERERKMKEIMRENNFNERRSEISIDESFRRKFKEINNEIMLVL